MQPITERDTSTCSVLRDLIDGSYCGLVLSVFGVLLVVFLFIELIKTTWASFSDRPANVPVWLRARINDSALHVSNVFDVP